MAFKMKTEWGKKKGWELQLLKWPDGRTMWRLTEKSGSCRPAFESEVELWKAMLESAPSLC